MADVSWFLLRLLPLPCSCISHTLSLTFLSIHCLLSYLALFSIMCHKSSSSKSEEKCLQTKMQKVTQLGGTDFNPMSSTAHISGDNKISQFLSLKLELISAVHLLSLFWVTLAVVLISIPVFIFILPFNKRLARRFVSEVSERLWVEAMSVIIPPTPMIVTGEMPMSSGCENNQAIIVANHQLDSGMCEASCSEL